MINFSCCKICNYADQTTGCFFTFGKTNVLLNCNYGSSDLEFPKSPLISLWRISPPK